jgi:predicted DCC family thiol-disulfide oxidoreductase YuxK
LQNDRIARPPSAAPSKKQKTSNQKRGPKKSMAPATPIAPHVSRYRPPAGWLVYDGECALCTRLVRWFRQPLERRGYSLVPLQSPWIAARLHISYGVAPEDLLKEMRVLTADGRCLGGSGAVLHLTREMWWTWPLWLIAQLPGIHRLLDVAYRTVATHRHCVSAAGQRIAACAVSKIAPVKSRRA